MSLDLGQWMGRHADRAASALDHFLPDASVEPTRLHEAMRYAALAPGKRVRPLLVYAAAEASGLTLTDDLPQPVDHAAVAVELIHAYSLVHDDLPCMDDDDLRRGRPTVHRQFDEATALLVGDALQSLAFDVLSRAQAPAPALLQAMQILAVASGSAGMAGGQAIDLASVGQRISREALEQMHRLKTGALLRASVALGGLLGGADADGLRRLDAYARALGLAFQVVDDVLDTTQSSAVLGKTAGKDAASDKPTYVSLLGLDEARALSLALRDEALASLQGFDVRAVRLRELAGFVVERQH